MFEETFCPTHPLPPLRSASATTFVSNTSHPLPYLTLFLQLVKACGRSVTLFGDATFPHSVAFSMDRVSTWLTRVDDGHLSSASSLSSSSSPCVAQSNKRGTHQPALSRCDTTPSRPGTAAVTHPSPLPVTAKRSPAGRRRRLTALTMINEDFDHLTDTLMCRIRTSQENHVKIRISGAQSSTPRSPLIHSVSSHLAEPRKS